MTASKRPSWPIVYAIKLRRKGDKRFAFVGDKGETYLRVHARRYVNYGEAQDAIDKSGPHPGFDIKVVEL